MTPMLRHVLVPALVAAASTAAHLSGAGPAPAGAQPAPGAAPPPAFVRLAGGWPGGAVTLEAGGGWALEAEFAEVTGYRPLAAGPADLALAPSGAPGAARQVPLVLGAGSFTTVLATPSGAATPGAAVALDVFRAPPDGSAALRVVNGSPDTGELRGVVAGVDLGVAAAGAAPATAAAVVPAGVQRVSLRAPSGAEAFALDVALAPGSASSVFVLGGAERPVRALLVADAVGLERLPVGFVPSDVPGPPTARPAAVTARSALLDGGTAATIAPVGRGPAPEDGRRTVGRHPRPSAGEQRPRTRRERRTLRWARRRRRLAAVALVGVACLGSACTPPPVDRADSPTAPARVAPTTPGEVPATAGQPPSTSPVAPEATRLRAPSLGIDAGLLPVGLDAAGVVIVPDDVTRVGVYSGGPAPGEVGPAVLVGHISSRGAFGRLHEAEPGVVLEVDRADGATVRFVVTGRRQVPKGAFPTAEVYAPSPVPALRLITCGGALLPDGLHFAENVIVDAVALT